MQDRGCNVVHPNALLDPGPHRDEDTGNVITILEIVFGE